MTKLLNSLALFLSLSAAPALAQSAPGGDTVPPVTSDPGAAQARRSSAPAQTGPSGSSPILGAQGLLQSLSDLDRPLSPEEITAYGASLQQQFPLTPELIRDYRKRLNEIESATAAPPTGFRPKALSKTIRVSLGTNGPTPEVLTAPGIVSVLSFFDRTGAPWPVASFVVGRKDLFEVYAMQEGSNQLAVSPLVTHGYSNLAISLVEEDQPIVLDLATNETQTHYRLDMSVNGLGPKAIIAPVTTKAPKMDSSDDVMMAFVQGAGIPNNAIPLGTDDGDVAVWRYNDNYYLRTNQTLISPSWQQTLSGPGGIKAYRLKPSPVALITRDGQVTRVRITR